jgi:hypothetical protein
VLRLAGLFLSTVLMTAQNTAPHYHSNCCYPLPPEKMQKIPPEIRAQLTAEKCLIPQNPNVIDDPQPNNAIHGSWAARGQDDWAVLCLKPDELLVRIFWSGKTSCDDKIVLDHVRSGDGHWDDPETFLWAASPQTIRAYNDAFGGRQLPVLDHSGLEVGGEEASIIYYCQQGKWLRFIGND